MVNITMMRGAQSGGVVTFVRPKKHSVRDPVIGKRSRVVNKKRTDLSKLIRAKVKSDVFSGGCRPALLPASHDTVQAFCGHTRFATSSKASFQGTHPLQWTFPTYRRVYNFSIMSRADGDTRFNSNFPKSVRCENFITHNGDFDFYELNEKTYDLEIIQKWLPIATGAPMPATVDSAAIAGFIDLLRTQGCFSLSARYAVCLGMPTSRMVDDISLANYPTPKQYDEVAEIFESSLNNELATKMIDEICFSQEQRQTLCNYVAAKMRGLDNEFVSLFTTEQNHDEEDGGKIGLFVRTVIDAFFDNDLLNSTKIFMSKASGSFGLCITSSLDSVRQICLASRGQTMSVAFYPSKGIVCYGSEASAVKAGVNMDFVGSEPDTLEQSHLDVDRDALRLDLDDLGGEICLIDWGSRTYNYPATSPLNKIVERHTLMNGSVNVYLLQENRSTKLSPNLYTRMTRLTDNQFIKPLPPSYDDPVLHDIKDIPKVCNDIQNDWRNLNPEGISYNRLTAWNLARRLRVRLEHHTKGQSQKTGTIDILLTGCEVSLWLAEQFGSDLQKAFPRLRIVSVSSNKLLGLYGQDMSIPVVGFPMSEKTQSLNDTIIIISNARNIFLVTSEWDTQIGKQLRSMHEDDGTFFNSRVFTTNVGMRPAEPCSVSVAATHQLLTNILQHVCIVILSDRRYRQASGSIICEQDLQILERCNQANITALQQIVGQTSSGTALQSEMARPLKELREAGDVWADHILENAKAYIMSFLYIFGTVVSGYPIASAVAMGAGLVAPWAFYLVRIIDAMIYFYLPQINVIILRLVQGRPLRHRMVGRTVVIADVPWVAQAADAFLSKLFACSYSIAGLNVLSGNPADHFVHRHTHRVVRGTLIVCGRPDGRLSALSSLEASVSLSINQASSIQSIGSTAESITIGHNPFKLPLSAKGIFLDRNRPLFLCEKLLGFVDEESTKRKSQQHRKGAIVAREGTNYYNLSLSSSHVRFEDGSRQLRNMRNAIIAYEDSSVHKLSSSTSRTRVRDAEIPPLENTRVNNAIVAEENTGEMSDKNDVSATPGRKYTETTKNSQTRSGQEVHLPLDKRVPIRSFSRTNSVGGHKLSQTPILPVEKRRSSTALLGAYMNLQQKQRSFDDKSLDNSTRLPVHSLVEMSIQEKKWSDNVRQMFDSLDTNNDGVLGREEFFAGYRQIKSDLSRDQLDRIFEECDLNADGCLTFSEFVDMMRMPEMDIAAIIQPTNRDKNGIIQVSASNEEFFGQDIIQGDNIGDFRNIAYSGATQSQHFAQELYESRIASLQRFVSMTVMFHQIALRVQSFFPKISFGFLGYRVDRTHSIMRIATTASPVSGADVRERMRVLQMYRKINDSVAIISSAWLSYKKAKEMERLAELEHLVSNKEGRRVKLVLETHDGKRSNRITVA
eukprot:scaffold43793_cov58-Attheya_sp.AAC.2